MINGKDLWVWHRAPGRSDHEPAGLARITFECIGDICRYVSKQDERIKELERQVAELRGRR